MLIKYMYVLSSSDFLICSDVLEVEQVSSGLFDFSNNSQWGIS